jgi:predicted ATPase
LLTSELIAVLFFRSLSRSNLTPMKLISGFSITNFRSIRRVELESVGDLTAVCGLNNSGKSNVLRALNLFFNDETDPGVPFDLGTDFSKLGASRRQKQKVSITVSFQLPAFFRFRKELEPVQKLLNSDSFSITKEWTRDSQVPGILLDSGSLTIEDASRILQFLSLIRFRYIPNRVAPIDIIRSEGGALRDSLYRRLNISKEQNDALFAQVEKQATTFIGTFSDRYSSVITDFENLKLSTPRNLGEVLFNLSYRLSVGIGQEVADTSQGSGAQSALMLETLRVLDEDYYKQFGWKQATVWAYEEPETSLHHSLEEKIADSLLTMTLEKGSRLQIIATTHSNVIVQYAEPAYYIERKDGATQLERIDSEDQLSRIWSAGVSEWHHPLLRYSRAPLILLEGKIDYNYFNHIRGLLPNGDKIRASYLGRLSEAQGSTGGDELYNYLRANLDAIKRRSKTAPIAIVLDSDKANENRWQKLLSGTNSTVIAWKSTDLNSALGKSFRGIERALGTAFVQKVCTTEKIPLTDDNGVFELLPKHAERFKTAADNTMRREPDAGELKYMISFFSRVALMLTKQDGHLV